MLLIVHKNYTWRYVQRMPCSLATGQPVKNQSQLNYFSGRIAGNDNKILNKAVSRSIIT